MSNRVFFAKVRHAQIESGGFMSLNKTIREFTVLSGEFVGHWTFKPAGRTSWSHNLVPAIGLDSPRGNRAPKWQPLQAHRENKIKETIVQFLTNDTPVEFSIHPNNKEFWVKGANAKLHAMKNLANVTDEYVAQALAEQPKRALSLPDLKLMGGLADRKTFSRVFLQTWSVQKAYKACIPHVKGWDNAWLDESPRSIQLAFGRSNWRERCMADPDLAKLTNQSAVVLRHVDGWIASSMDEHRRLKIKEWRHLFDNYTLKDIEAIQDTRGHFLLDLYRPVLAESVEGRRFLMHVEEKNWKGILDHHDWFVQFIQTQTDLARAREQEIRRVALEARNAQRLLAGGQVLTEEQEQAIARAEYLAEQEQEQAKIEKDVIVWHAKAMEVRLIDGVTPITTKEQMVLEGKEMSHCVGGYWWHTRSHIYGFKLGSERATLEYSKKQNIQFRGVGNCSPSKEMHDMLKTFLELNK